MSTVSTSLTLLSALLSADQSGATLKFSQISKLISRLRMLDLNFGKVFGKFLDQLGKAFDGESSSKSDEENLKFYRNRLKMLELYGKGQKGKFKRYGVNLFLLGTMQSDWESSMVKEGEKKYIKNKSKNGKRRQLAEESGEEGGFSFSNFAKEAKYWIYLLSWIIKIVLLGLISEIRKQKTIPSEKFIKIVQILKRVHFLVFNLVIIDIIFVGTRTLMHTRITK